MQEAAIVIRNTSSFCKHVEQNVPPELDVHVVVDNYATHKHARVRRWLGLHPRWHVHYTPTYASWLNQVETWFSIITQRAIRRGSFRSVRQLVEKIERFVAAHKCAQPAVCLDGNGLISILQKVQRLCQHICGTAH